MTKFNRLTVYMAISRERQTKNPNMFPKIEQIIAISTHRGIAEDRLKDFCRRYKQDKDLDYLVTDYKLSMPKDVTLVRKLHIGKKYKVTYIDYAKQEKIIKKMKHKKWFEFERTQISSRGI